MKNHVKIEIDLPSAGEAEILMAELSENDFYAFEQNDNSLSAYINEGDFVEERLKFILPQNKTYAYSVIPGKNWNAEWESELQPVIINDFVGIRASFHETIKGVIHEIIITPKMSFGTGHHDTTFLMVEQMGKTRFSNKSVLDFGTGTGILAILAEKLGADAITAIDCDEWSIQNALENIAANQCKSIEIQKRDNIEGLSSVNIILANINLRILTDNAKNLSGVLQPGSLLIMSGFLVNDEEIITSVFLENHFLKKDRNQKNEWVVLILEKC